MSGAPVEATTAEGNLPPISAIVRLGVAQLFPPAIVTAMSEAPPQIEDGRRARRARNRDAVIEALFDLLSEDQGMPGIETIAERAGVSISSIFRYFDGLEDLKHETIQRYFIRYADLFPIPTIGVGSLDERTQRFVNARTRLYDAIAPIGRLARARAYDQPVIAEPLERARALFTDQTREQFATEISKLASEDAEQLVALIDSVTSFESWDLQTGHHKHSNQQVHAAWVFALTRLLAA